MLEYKVCIKNLILVEIDTSNVTWEHKKTVHYNKKFSECD